METICKITFVNVRKLEGTSRIYFNSNILTSMFYEGGNCRHEIVKRLTQELFLKYFYLLFSKLADVLRKCIS